MKPHALHRLDTAHRDLDGLPLLNADGDWLGNVSTFITDQEHRARFAVVTTARSWRSGGGRLLVPHACLRASDDTTGFVLTADETLLDDAPAFETASQVNEADYARSVRAHYSA